MKINFLGKFPDGYSYYGKLSELDNYDIEYLTPLNLDEIWYWYSTAPYEGSGQILMRKGNLYDHHNAGHCSCYSACERVEFKGKALDKLVNSLGVEFMEQECKPLFEMAGYKF